MIPENTLSQRELKRYSRQTSLSEIGITGQEKLKKASVAVVGAGGLGCPLLQYLTAAGTGRLGIIDFDTVDETNLQRQILYRSDDQGKLKTIIARKRLEQLNPLVKTEIFNIRLDTSNAMMILKDFDIIADATDNFETRYVINDSCILLNKPMVHGAIHEYEGQVSVFNYEGGPTYRCFNPGDSTRKLKNPSGSDTGILGVLPGLTGTLMANEIIKMITGAGIVLNGKILVFNILHNSFYLLDIKKAPHDNI
ncbi:MAG TPA: HesA/MoeB/ThiF family protein [Bacteroidales bacterium]|nr:HesA/MoeB/ThiF family protein [Bacteroidales bacterium]